MHLVCDIQHKAKWEKATSGAHFLCLPFSDRSPYLFLKIMDVFSFMTKQINKTCHKPKGIHYVGNMGKNRPITRNRTNWLSYYLVSKQKDKLSQRGDVQSIRTSHWKFLVQFQFLFCLLEESICSLINNVRPNKAQTTSNAN